MPDLRSRIAVGACSLVVSLGVAWVLFPSRVPLVRFVDGSESSHDLLLERSRTKATGDVLHAALDEATAVRLFPSLERQLGSRTPRRRFDPVTFFENVPHFHASQRFPEHPDGVWNVDTNELGFRSDAGVREDRPRLRILVTGDSHTEGAVSNSESFCAGLERLLRESDAERDAEVLNAGTGGYTFQNYLGVLEKHRDLEPDVFVAVVFGGNDFHRTLPVWRYFRHEARPRDVAFWSDGVARAVRETGPAMAQGLAQVVYFTRNPRECDVALAAGVEVVSELHRRCAEQGARFVCAYLPPVIDVQPWLVEEETAAASSACELDPADLRVTDRLADAWIAALDAQGVEVLDLRPALRAATEPAYWRSDHHLNIHGHSLVARALLGAVDPR